MRAIHWFQLAFAIVTVTFVTVLMLQTNDPIGMKVGKIGGVASLQMLFLLITLSNRKTNAARLVAQKGITQ
jgi:hypothetical protein